jgi:hypothetical protein
MEFTAQAIASRRHDIGALRVTSNKSLVVCMYHGRVLIYLAIIIYIHYMHSLHDAYIDILCIIDCLRIYRILESIDLAASHCERCREVAKDRDNDVE